MDSCGVWEEVCVPRAIICIGAQPLALKLWQNTKLTIYNILIHLTNYIRPTCVEAIYFYRDTVFTCDHTITALEALTNVWEWACGSIEVCDELTLVLVLTDVSALLLGVDMELGVDVVILIVFTLHTWAGAGHWRAMGFNMRKHQGREVSKNG